MLAALLAAETITEHSKTSFYVAAGLLIASAVCLAAVGIRRHETFPSSGGAQRAVIGWFVVIVAATMITAVITG
jgi:deoxyribodipyrimidine photolyase-like uncharacterized protein